MPSSGTTALATSGDGVVTAIAAGVFNDVDCWIYAMNTGAAGGFISWDATNSVWYALPAMTGFIVPRARVMGAIKIKRIPSGTDLSGVYVGAELA